MSKYSKENSVADVLRRRPHPTIESLVVLQTSLDDLFSSSLFMLLIRILVILLMFANQILVPWVCFFFGRVAFFLRILSCVMVFPCVQILRNVHSRGLASHFGVANTTQMLREGFFGQTMRRDS